MRAPAPVPELTAIPSRVTAFGEELLTASAIVDDLGTFAAGQARTSGLRGAAEEAYEHARKRIGAEGEECSLALRAVAGRVLDHAAELDRLSHERADLVVRYDDLVGLAGQVSAPDAAMHVAPAIPGPVPPGPELISAAFDDYEAARTAWIERVSAAETRMLDVFRSALGLDRVERKYAGVADPADGVVATMPSAGAGPAAVAVWWRSLTRAQRAALIGADPEAIGNRDGIPAWARDRADVVLLHRDLHTLGQAPSERLTPAQRHRLANALAAEEARTLMHEAVDPRTGDHYSTQLYLYDPDAFGGDGRVAIALGDLDRARDVALTVPGFGTDAGSAPVQSVTAAHVEQAADVLGDGRSHATMFWIGYDAPDNLPWREGGADAVGVLTGGMARAGGRHLVATIDGLEQMRRHDPHLTVIGHSYGSTTAALGSSYSAPGTVDDLVLVGSPGAGQEIRRADDTGVPAGHVWAGRDSGDVIARLGNHGHFGLQSALGAGLGSDPAAEGFGARRFEAESGRRGVGTAIAAHLGYYDHDGESLANIGRIVDGEYGEVAGAPSVRDPVLPHPARHLRAIVTSEGTLLGDIGDAVRHPSHVVDDMVDGLVRGKDVFDDVVGGPVDPEAARTPTTPDTDGR